MNRDQGWFYSFVLHKTKTRIFSRSWVYYHFSGSDFWVAASPSLSEVNKYEQRRFRASAAPLTPPVHLKSCCSRRTSPLRDGALPCAACGGRCVPAVCCGAEPQSASCSSNCADMIHISFGRGVKPSTCRGNRHVAGSLTRRSNTRT